MAERNVLQYRRMWPVLVAGIFEPVFYLLSIGIGVGSLVGDVTYAGRAIPYETFVASGMLATAAMNGAIFDTTFNFFIRLKYGKLYDAVLATPLEPRDVALGEVTWALSRGAFYSTCFLVTMLAFGLLESWWAILALPATILVGAAFASIGLASATRLRSFLDFDFVNLAITPMFLFSATFFPLSRLPRRRGRRGALDAAVPGRGAVPGAHHRRDRRRPPGQRRLPAGHGRARRVSGQLPHRPHAPQLRFWAARFVSDAWICTPECLVRCSGPRGLLPMRGFAAQSVRGRGGS